LVGAGEVEDEDEVAGADDVIEIDVAIAAVVASRMLFVTGPM
jgi:hypothetical protein